MKPHVKLDMNVGTFRNMTKEQFYALQELLADGKWETVENDPLRIDGAGEYLGVYLPNIFIGIERDGYTHS